MIGYVIEALTVAGALASWLGITALASALAALALFKWLGSKWIENKFSKSLEEYKADQGRELERLRHKINSAFDRTRRLHDREFETLPELWAKLTESYTSACAYVSVFKSYADINRLDDEALDEFLNGTNFREFEKRDVKNAHDKQAVFSKLHNFYQHEVTMRKLVELDNVFRTKGIFIKPELEEKFSAMIHSIHRAVQEHNFQEVHPGSIPRTREKADHLETYGKELLAEIKKDVAARLWDSTEATV